MIKKIQMKNFILFEEEYINFENEAIGFVGETGAGKSIVFQAIKMLIGQRSDISYIMPGKNFYELEMEYLYKNKIYNIFRKVSIDKKNEIKINDKVVTLNDLKIFFKTKINIHGQNETEEILKKDKHMSLIDKNINDDSKLNFEKIYDKYILTLNELNNLIKKNKTSEEDLEIIDYKIKKLEEVKSIPKEEELDLKIQKMKKLVNEQKINELIVSNINLIENNILDIKSNNLYSDLDNELVFKIEKAYDLLSDVGFESSKKLNSDFNSELNILEDHMSNLKILKRKYNTNYDGLIEKLNKLEEDREKNINISFLIIEKEKELKEIKAKMNETNKILFDKRIELANNIVENVNKNFISLKMKHAKMKLHIERDIITDKGLENISFLIKTNEGHKYYDIDDIASGGEKSRIMLNFKKVLNNLNKFDVLLLDEIDKGVSSDVALRIGDMIMEMSQDSQILIISHTVQVISKLKTLYEVKKTTQFNQTNSTINKLTDENKKVFLNDMLIF